MPQPKSLRTVRPRTPEQITNQLLQMVRQHQSEQVAENKAAVNKYASLLPFGLGPALGSFVVNSLIPSKESKRRKREEDALRKELKYSQQYYYNPNQSLEDSFRGLGR